MPLLRKLLENHPLANVTYLLVVVMGLIAYVQLPRAQYPEINLNWVMVVTALPGASASDVEKLVTEPLEDAIRKVADIMSLVTSIAVMLASYAREASIALIISVL